MHSCSSFLSFFLFTSFLLVSPFCARISDAQTGFQQTPDSVPLTQQEQRYLSDKGHLTIVCDPAWPPFDFIDESGHHAGLAADYMRLFSERIGINIRLIPTKSWVESLAMAQGSHCDLVTMLNATPERSLYLNFTTPYYEMRHAIISRSESEAVGGIFDLRDKTMAVVDGYKIEEDLRRDYPDIKLLKAQTSKEALNMVSKGKAYATVITPIEAAHLSRKYQFPNLKIIGTTDYNNQLAVGVQKEELIALSIMQKAVDSITEQDRQYIQEKWMTLPEAAPADYTNTWFLIGLLLLPLAGAGFLYWKRR